MIEGGNISLTCDYVDVVPFGNKSILYVGSSSMIRDKVWLV